MIVVALILILSVWIYTKFIRPPPELKDIPALPILKCAWAILTDQDFTVLYRENMQDILNKHGIARMWMFGSWVVIVGRVDEAKKVLNDNNSFPKFLLSENFKSSLAANFYCKNVVYSNGDTWRRHRRIVNPSLNRPWPVDVMGKVMLDLFGKWDEMSDRLIDTPSWNQRLTLDVLGELVFGIKFEAVKDQHAKSVNLYEQVTKALLVPLFFFFPFLDRFRPDAVQKVNEFNAWLASIIEQRLQALKSGEYKSDLDDSRQDTLTLMVKACYEEQLKDSSNVENITSEELLSNLRIFFVAGHDTTSTSLTSALYHFAKYPDIQQKLREEVFQIMGKEAEDTVPTKEQLQEMKYLQMFIKENMRLVPPLGISLDRTTKEATEVMGHTIPPKTLLWLHLYHIHRDERYFPNPEKFDLDRFSPENDRASSVNWLPFSTGARQCPGMALSLLEQKLVLSMILSRYTIDFPKGEADWTMKFKGSNLLTHEKLELSVRHIVQK